MTIFNKVLVLEIIVKICVGYLGIVVVSHHVFEFREELFLRFGDGFIHLLNAGFKFPLLFLVVFLDQVELVCEVICKILHEFSTFIGHGSSQCSLGLCHLLQGGIIIFCTAMLFLCSMSTRGGSNVQEVFLVKLEHGVHFQALWAGVAGIRVGIVTTGIGLNFAANPLAYWDKHFD